MSLSVNFPSVAPSLNLDFAGSERLDPRITFTRATTARYYDGVTTAKAEENLLIRSQEFNESAWTAEIVTVTTNTEVAPDGTTTAETITRTVSTGVPTIRGPSVPPVLSVVSGLPYTISVFAKKNTNDFFQITTFGSGDPLGTGRANFNLDTGVVGTVNGGTSTITSVGNGWYRCTYTVTASASGSPLVYFGIITTSTAVRFESSTGLGTESIYLWGAQVEQRSAVTAYTPTTTQPITNYIPVLLTAAAGVARFDHTPTTGTSLGLLVEEQRTNLLTYSEDFANAAWGKSDSSVTSNAVIAPDGTLTADLIIPNSNSVTDHSVNQSTSIASGVPVVVSIFAKAAGYNFLFIRGFGLGGVGGARFNLSTGTVTGVSNYTSATITAVGNGWYRCVAIGTTALSSGGVFFNVSNTDTYQAWSGDGYSGIALWGGQLESGTGITFPTSYIPTGVATATRNADVATMTGTNFSSWYNQSEMTFYGEYAPIYTASASVPSNTPHLLQADFTASTSNNYAIRGAVNGQSQEFVARSVTSGIQFPFVSSLGFLQAGVFRKVAYGINSTQLAPVANGISGSVLTNNVASTMTTPDRLTIGTGTGGSPPYQLNGHIRRIAYYPSRLTNEQLVALTR